MSRMKWLTVPNEWWDSINEKYSVLGLLLLYSIVVVVPLLIWGPVGFAFGFLAYCCIGLYRIVYAIYISVSKTI